MKPSPNWMSMSSNTRFGPVVSCVVARRSCSSVRMRTPSTVPMHAEYMRAIERASPIPFAAGISAAWSARVFHTSGPESEPPGAKSALPSVVSGPMNCVHERGDLGVFGDERVGETTDQRRDAPFLRLGEPDPEVEAERGRDLVVEIRADALARDAANDFTDEPSVRGRVVPVL